MHRGRGNEAVPEITIGCASAVVGNASGCGCSTQFSGNGLHAGVVRVDRCKTRLARLVVRASGQVEGYGVRILLQEVESAWPMVTLTEVPKGYGPSKLLVNKGTFSMVSGSAGSTW